MWGCGGDSAAQSHSVGGVKSAQKVCTIVDDCRERGNRALVIVF